MIEATFRHIYQKVCINPLLKMGLFNRLHPIVLTLLACATGVCALPLLALQLPFYALGFLGISGFLDTLDGSLARHTGKTSNKGAALDIVSDRAVEFSVILGLYFVEPLDRALPCLLMAGSVLLCVTSFLVVGIFTQNSSGKSFHYSRGLIERAEAFVFFTAMIVFPRAFLPMAYAFSALVLLTALIRILQFATYRE